MKPLLMATSNDGKLRELRAMLADAGIEILSLKDFKAVPEAVEDGDTFEANAIIKALHYFQHTRVTTLADDSGLEVEALGGAPGVHSARFAGPHGNDSANNRKLIDMLRERPGCSRSAQFRCVVALVDDGQVVATGNGHVRGEIIDEPRGGLGFGYDPHFLIPRLGLTKAELPLKVKNSISHRGMALRTILPEIIRILSP